MTKDWEENTARNTRMTGCHVVTRDEITKLEEFTISSDQPLQLIVYTETADFLLHKTIYILKKTYVLEKS